MARSRLGPDVPITSPWVERRDEGMTHPEFERRADAAMERYVEGELAAFEDLYGILGPRIYGYLVSMVGNRSMADDLLQSTFMKLHTARHGWIRGGRVLPYVYAIARNAAIDEIRRASHARVRLTQSGKLPDTTSEEPAADEDDQTTDVLRAAVLALPPHYREALLLTKQEERSVREAALIVGTTELAIKLRIHRAYKLLRRSLERTAADRQENYT